MISGASPNAGKTFVSSNLSSVISQTGKKVIFIDADLRKSYTHKLFNIKTRMDFLIIYQEELHLIKS